MEKTGVFGMAKLFFATAVAAIALGLAAGSASAGPAPADETVWICKPGQVDDLCAGSIATTGGTPPGTLGFTRPEDPPVDCFYVYPTVSEQATPNANLDKDPEVKRVVVQQARMFSRVCDVYAPMYRQETSPGIYTENTEVAYQSVLSAWKDYLANYNDGRGVILIGHSQGSATLGRLVDEEIDPVPALRKRLVGAILPGANIHVAKGELAGGMYDNVPACSEVGEYGCLVAFSMYNGTPGDNPAFGDVGSGYWAYKIPRPDRDQSEVVCVNPARLSGDDFLTPLINLDYLLGPPPGGVETSFWGGYPDTVTASCERDGSKHWLNVDFNGTPDPFLSGVLPFVASGINWHVPEVNVAEDNLVRIAALQTDSYIAEQARVSKLKAKLGKLKRGLVNAKKGLAAKRRQAARLSKKARKASGKKRRILKRKAKKADRKAAAKRRQVRSIKKKIALTKRQIG